MECVRPILVGKSYHTKRYVPCGKCSQCKANLRAEWCGRLTIELMDSFKSYFVTLTYADENLRFNSMAIASVWKDDIQRYLKRLRKRLGSCVRFFCTAEYGSQTRRPHYHLLFFFSKDLEKLELKETELFDVISDSWGKGLCHFGEVTPASIAYTTKYCMKDSACPTGANAVFRLMSRVPPLGSSKDYSEEELGSFRYYGQTFKTSRLFRDKVKKSFDVDYQRLIKLEAEKSTILRYMRNFSSWCVKNNKDKNDLKVQDEYRKFLENKKQQKNMLLQKHVKQEIL